MGVLRLSFELGMIDILTESSCLFQQLCSPRKEKLSYVYYKFVYLQKNMGNNPVKMTYNTMYEPTDEYVFEVS